MTESNLETARRAFVAAFSQPPDLETAREIFDPAIVLTSNWGVGETEYRGVDGLLDRLAEMAAAFDPWHQDLERLLDGGQDRVVALLHLSAHGKESGVPVEFRWAMVVELRDGRIVSARAFIDRDEALKAAGLAD